MKVATLLIVLMSNQGFWIGGHEGTINIRPAAWGGLPAADLFWTLTFNNLVISSGNAALAPSWNATLRIAPPRCRQRIVLTWDYRLLDHASGKELAKGGVPIRLFPDDINADMAQRVGKKRLAVLDTVSGVPALLKLRKVPFTRVDAESQLMFSDADVVIVGENALNDSPFDQFILLSLARNGASVLILRQERVERLAGINVFRRDPPSKFEWRTDHPLLRDFESEDLQSWTQRAQNFLVMRLPATEGALELGYYPPEFPNDLLIAHDSVFLTERLGTGRLATCELSLGNWVEDPRSQMFLRNAIDYLLTPPQPTAALLEKGSSVISASRSETTIPIYAGSDQ